MHLGDTITVMGLPCHYWCTVMGRTAITNMPQLVCDYWCRIMGRTAH